MRNCIRGMKWVYRALLGVRSVAGGAFMRAARALFGIDPHKFVFSSFAGRAYSDSPRAVSERLHQMAPDAKIIWHLARGAAGAGELPSYVRAARPRMPGILFHYATARAVVDNFNRPWYIPKLPGQLYIQTWHGDRGFKKVMFDMADGVDYPDGRNMDLAVSGSDFATGVYRSAFQYPGEVLKCGVPRNDILINPPGGLALRVRGELGIAAEERVVLYAPTFRDATVGRAQPPAFDIAAALDQLGRRAGGKWRALVRGHADSGAIVCQSALDVSGYPEMARLLLIADLLITDYSSSAGDFALLGRPLILYQPDIAGYIERDRHLYFDMDASPYWTAHSPEELYAYFGRFGEAPQNCRAILSFYGAHESGHAAEAVCEYILSDGGERHGT